MTTTPNSGEDWNDDRIDAAFEARANRAPVPPPSLTESVLTRVGSTRSPMWRGRRFALAGAVAALVVAIAGGSILAQLGTEPDASPPPTSTVQSTDTPTAEPSRSSTADLVAALGGQMTVSEALEVRDGDEGNREIVVEGFLSASTEVACAPEPSSSSPMPICSTTRPRLMERRETLEADQSPEGPAFWASLGVVPDPVVPAAGQPPGTPLPVVVVGHFNDRRVPENPCVPDDPEPCLLIGYLNPFVIDRILEIDGVEQPVATERHNDAEATEHEADVEALVAAVAPMTVVLSRQLVTLDQALIAEPILAGDPIIPNMNPASVAWLVTTVDIGGPIPRPRTFMLLDGANWFAEITARGAEMLERQAPAPSGDPQQVLPSGDPSAFADAPPTVLGMPVLGVAEAVAAHRDASSTRNEYAIRAWYVAPRPGLSCVVDGAIVPRPGSIVPPCDTERRWLLDDPSQIGIERGQLRRDPARFPPVLNPLLPTDVPFDVDTWGGDVVRPRPVVVLGHFNDDRVEGYRGAFYFVIDALAWDERGTVGSLDRVVRFSTAETEDPSSVLARIEAVSQRRALATWMTIVDAGSVVVDNVYHGGTAEEFESGPPVWIVRRLVEHERDGVGRHAVETGYTSDGGTRVWYTPTPDADADLATSLDIRNPDGNTQLVHVFDYDQIVTSVGGTVGSGPFDWVRPPGNLTSDMEVAHGRTTRDVVIRWRGPDCAETWRVIVVAGSEESMYLNPFRSDDCEGNDVARMIVIRFQENVDLRRITGEFCCG